MKDFFQSKKFLNSRKFSKLNQDIQPRTVVVEMLDGTIRKHHKIKEPWRYITRCKQNPDVKNAWIEDK